MSRPVNADSGETVDKIRGAALRILEEDGPDAVSFRRVAALAEVSVGTIRYYFATREALVEACLDTYQDSLVGLEEQWSAVLRDAEDLDMAIRLSVAAAFDLLRGRRELARLRLLSSIRDGEMNATRRKNNRDPFMNHAVKVLAKRTGREHQALRLAVDTLMRSVSWYAACSANELQSATGLDDAEAAEAAVRVHCGDVGVRLILVDLD